MANASTAEEIGAAIAVALMEESEDERSVLLRLALIAIFLKLLCKKENMKIVNSKSVIFQMLIYPTIFLWIVNLSIAI